MKRKLHRSRRSVFGRRGMHPALKTLLWLVVCVAVVAVGYFGAMLLSGDGLPHVQPDVQVGGNDTPSAPEKPADTPSVNDDEDITDKPTPDTPTTTESIRAFYLPTSALSVDSLSQGSLLQDAVSAGFNAVIFDLKDANGTLFYEFADARAKKVNAYATNALTADALKTLFSMMRDAGLQPIPRLYAFCDDAAAKVLTDARISHTTNHSWAWYDGVPANGAKKWLNPYSATAQDYILALAEELKAQGAAGIMLDGVQFPSQLKSAYLGEEAATVTKDDALTAFVSRARTQLGDECPVLLGCTSAGALGNDTKIYGGNPLTFGATIAAPLLSYDKNMQESVEKMVLRTQVLEQKSTLAPMLAVNDLTPRQINEAIAACVAGGVDSFILVPPEGNYDFSVYTLP